jgi:hypothetical protein
MRFGVECPYPSAAAFAFSALASRCAKARILSATLIPSSSLIRYAARIARRLAELHGHQSKCLALAGTAHQGHGKDAERRLI